MSKGSDNHEIMTLNQQADAAALIKDIERTLSEDVFMYGEKCDLIAAAVKRYKEKWPWQRS